MGTLSKASALACAAVLASALSLATVPPGALARIAAGAASYQSASTTPPTPAGARSGSGSGSGSHHSGARCARFGGAHRGSRRTHHSVRRARRKVANGPAARAPVRARKTRCGLRRRHIRGRHLRRPHRTHHARTHPHTGAVHRNAARHRSRKRVSASRPAAGSSSECANASLMPSDENRSLVRAAILCLINRERTTAGERPLVPVASLEVAAQGHSDDMGHGDYFEHLSPNGETPSARMRASGYLKGAQFYEVGENIAFGTGWLATPRAIVAGWMASPGHRANILDAHYHDTGIGACAHPPVSFAGNQRGAVYTEDFGVTSS